VVTNAAVTIMMLQHGQANFKIYVRSIGALTVIVLYLKFFYFLRVFDNTAPLIRMIIQISFDIRYFIMVFFIAVIGFGNGLYILSENNPPDTEFTKGFVDAILQVYRMALGDFNTDNFGSVNVWLVWCVFLVSTLLIMIILLNLLIAIMGDSFGRVQETAEQAMIQERLQLIIDNTFLVDRQALFKDVKYIVSVRIDEERQQQVEEEKEKGEAIIKYVKERFDELQKR